MVLCMVMMLLWGAGDAKAAEATPIPWTVYYGLEDQSGQFDPFEVIVVEAQHIHPIRDLVTKDKKVLGYISLGEMNESHPLFSEAKAQGLLLESSENWKGAHLVDLREPAWQAMVVESVIPMVLHYGVRGLFMDTLDNAIMLERRDPKAYQGMQEAAAELVARIRAHYPEVLLMQNRGFELFEETSPHVDMLLAESTYSSYRFKEKEHFLLSDDEREYYHVQLKRARKLAPQMPIFTLDYWDMEDGETVRKIYAAQRDAGYHPYVAPISLTEVVQGPGR
jgi:uncharacterized protein (TIGR01370 family)